MNREFLSNYGTREREENQKTLELASVDLTKGKEFYKSRYKRLNTPVGWNAAFESIWPQIPIYGTLFIEIYPVATERFAAYHGFEITDIDRLINFAKDTRRVAFILSGDPEEYVGLDFLDPIFTEFKPRIALGLFDSKYALQTGKFKEALIEFDTLAGLSFYKYIEKVSNEPNIRRYYGPGVDLKKRVEHAAYTFASLELLGYHESKETISRALTEEPFLAVRLLDTLNDLIVDPSVNPFNAIHTVPQQEIEWSTTNLPKSANPQLANDSQLSICEIGKFLMNKLVLHPTSFEACRAMCDKYEHNDLYEVESALQRAVEMGDYSAIKTESNQLSAILDNVWQDANKVGSRTNMIRGGIPIGMAILGGVAAGLTGAYTGLLASLGLGLGFNLVDTFVQVKTDSISEKIAKGLTPNYLVNIFDFKQSYSVKK